MEPLPRAGLGSAKRWECLTAQARGRGARAHQIAHHVDHNLHGTARGHDAGHWRSVPLENGVQHSRYVFVAGIVLGFQAGRGGAGGPTR